MSSVIDGLTMSEVRRCLQKIRSAWDEQTPWGPFNSSAVIIEPERTGGKVMTMSKFAWLFVIGHHTNRKRHKKL